ncbi:MAG: hypothetical protein H7269_11445 [Cellulomonas sp.]|nr:hypothetical protein [Cellulomonas sp.]
MDRVIRVIGADPELAMQVLRQVSSCAVAARRRVRRRPALGCPALAAVLAREENDFSGSRRPASRRSPSRTPTSPRSRRH